MGAPFLRMCARVCACVWILLSLTTYVSSYISALHISARFQCLLQARGDQETGRSQGQLFLSCFSYLYNHGVTRSHLAFLSLIPPKFVVWGTELYVMRLWEVEGLSDPILIY